MTPIRFNLLAEEQLAEKRSARDPVKVAIASGIALVAIAVGIGTLISLQASQVQKKESGLQAQWEKLSAPEARRASEELMAAKALAEDLVLIGNKRPLYAPQLAILKDVIPETIQLMRAVYVLNVESQQDAPMVPDGNAKPRPRRTVFRQRVTLQLEGRATSARPEIEVDDFIQTLKTHPSLTNMITGVQLRSISRISKAGDGTSGGTTPQAAFVIDCQYKELK